MGKASKSKPVKNPKVSIADAAGNSPPDAQIYTNADDVPDTIWSSMFNTYYKIMSSFADAALKSERLTADEKDVLKVAVDRSSGAVSRLLSRSGADCSKNDALEFLSSAFTVGIFSTPTPDYIESIAKAPFSKGGKNSGLNRLMKAEVSWRALALELAKESRKENSNGKLDFVAEYIEDNWKQRRKELNDVRIGKLPERDYLKTTISQWIKDGSLAAKKK
jgi:hypothetical protein